MKAMILWAAGAVLAANTMTHAQAPAPASPDPAAPVYIVGYIDVLSASKHQAMNLLNRFRSACAKESGNLRCEVAQRMEQQNEFAIMEVWKDQAAFKAHADGPGAQLRDKLKPMLASPYDERVQTAYAVAPPQPAPAGRIVYAITHIDIIPVPPILAKAIPLLAPAAEAGRKDAGNGRLELLQQLAPRTNHFTFVEVWSSRRALEAHQAQPHSMQFREQLQPVIGALYDERLYKVLD